MFDKVNAAKTEVKLPFNVAVVGVFGMIVCVRVQLLLDCHVHILDIYKGTSGKFCKYLATFNVAVFSGHIML